MLRKSLVAALALLVAPLFTTGSGVTRIAAAGPQLSVTAPLTGDVGRSAEIDLTLTDASVVAGLESAVRYDEAAGEFGGVLFGPGGGTGNVMTTLATNSTGGVAFAAYTCTVTGCPAADPVAARNALEHITIRLTPLVAGPLTVSLDQLKFVDLSGRSVDVDVPVHDVTIDVGAGGAPSGGQPVGYSLPADASAADGAAFDVDGSGAVSSIDVNTLASSWSDARRFGVCKTDLQADPNGDGCLDVADLQAVAGSSVQSAPATVTRAFATEGVVTSALGAPIVVNTINDLPDSNIGNGKCVTSAGDCSLRAAIHEANASPGADVINFAIPGGGVQTIQLGGPLPTITDGGLTINGYTQPGAAANTDPLISNAVITVAIEGKGSSLTDPATGFDAFKVVSSNNVFRGLSIYNVFNHFELSGPNATFNQILGNFIGSDPASNFIAPHATEGGSGITMVSGANHNRVGSPTLADRNVIAGTPSTGIRIQHEGTNVNVVQNNIFGLKPHGDAALPMGFSGVDIQFGAKNNVVGGAPGEGNVLDGAVRAQGVDLSHQEDTTGNTVQNNLIGTTPAGNASPAFTHNLRGVAFKDGVLGNFVKDNVIGGSEDEALWVRFDFNGRNDISGNRVGVARDGSAIPNALHGMFVQGHDFQITGNVFANNAKGGILVTNEAGSPPTTTKRNRLSGNTFGANGGLAIDLAPPAGPTPNDANDADSGPNTLLNYPTFDPASTTSATGKACGGCRVEVYKSVADAAGRGVGQKLIGCDTATPSGSFKLNIAQVAVGETISGIAIDADGNTSEFSPLANVTTVGAPAPKPACLSAASLVSLQPARLLDTRPNLPTVDGQFQGIGQLGRGQTIELQVNGRGGVPVNAESVVLNVTVTEPVGSGFVTVFPCGSPRPLASNLNYVINQNVPNAVISRVGAGGTVCLFVSEATHLVVDVNGFFPPSSAFFSLVPARLLDTRGQPTVDGLFQGPTPVVRDTTLPLTVLGRGGVPGDATAVVLNVTATEPIASGFVTVFPCGEGRPNASNLNFVGNQTVPNMAISRVGAAGQVCLYANETTHLVVDVTGYFSADSSFISLVPARLLETRTGTGLTTVDQLFNGLGQQGRGSTLQLQVTGRGGVSSGASAVVLNVTASGAAGPGFVTVYPCGQTQPVASSLNYLAGQNVPNAVVAKIGAGGNVCLFVSEATHLVADVDGYFFPGT
jgi:CSLREA domain-containing protein